MGQALYRKYRSKTLAEMVGQEHVIEALSGSIKGGRISHAYLFTGPRGVGKTSAARILAHEINNLPYNDTQRLDIIEIDAASNRRIDDIRDLRDKVHIAPTSAKYKVYIIDEVHMLTGESFNALLKTLEEPPEHVVFILATTEVHKLPATIISRTQRYNFRPVELPKVITHLRSIAKQEKIEVDDAALELIAEHGEGSFRDSINLLDQLANINGGKIDAPAVERGLGLPPKQAVTSLVGAVIKKDYMALINQLGELDAQGITTAALLPQIIRRLQSAAAQQPALYALLDKLLDIPRAYNPRPKLLTTLVQFALPEVDGAQNSSAAASERPTSPVRPSTALKHQPTPVAPAKPILHVKKPQPPKRTALQPEEQHTQGQQLAQLTQEQWVSVLATIRQGSPPMYSVLRQAEPIFDAKAQTHTLKFRYQLHRKKIEDSKPKKAIATAMLARLGGAPTVLTEVDAAAHAPDVNLPAAPPEVDETTSSVITMMGGGEVVNA